MFGIGPPFAYHRASTGASASASGNERGCIGIHFELLRQLEGSWRSMVVKHMILKCLQVNMVEIPYGVGALLDALEVLVLMKLRRSGNLMVRRDDVPGEIWEYRRLV